MLSMATLDTLELLVSLSALPCSCLESSSKKKKVGSFFNATVVTCIFLLLSNTNDIEI